MKKSNLLNLDRWLLALIVGLSLFGLFLITDASIVVAQLNFDDKFHYLKRQSIWLALGWAIMLIISRIPYQYFKKLTWPILLSSLALLGLVLIPQFGSKKLGAQRWLNIGPLSFQPAELAKISLVLLGATLLGKEEREVRQLSAIPPAASKPFALYLFILIIVAGLILLEPDLGTTVLIVTLGVSLSFLAGFAPWKLTLLLIAGLALGTWLILSSPYRQARLQTFLHPQSDPQGASYHTKQILLALGGGGLFGRGIGQSRQKYAYLPEVVTDSIFAVLAEEMGFVGATLFILSIMLLSLRCLKVAATAPDEFSRLLCAGVGLMIGCQAILNLGAMVGILPLTGIPLPLVSYGGSSLLVNLAGLGMVLSVSRCKIKQR